jgi:hypothetical protein
VTPSALALANETSEKTMPHGHPIVFLSPREVRALEIPRDYILLEDCHLVRGGITLIGGPPGVGKSRALLGLALAGATDQAWFGLDVRARFKTAILQTENGLVRLKQEFDDIAENGLEDYVRICLPPPNGLTIRDPSFCTSVWSQLKKFNPDVIAIDPFNSIAQDDRMYDYRDALNALRNFAAGFEKDVALVIIAHTRKPRGDERPKGRDLLHEFSGSHVLLTAARCAFIMQHASNDPDDDRIVWTCCKNNDGPLGSRSVWQRRNGLFLPVEDFRIEDLEVVSSPRRTVTADDIRAVLAGGKAMTRNDVKKELMDRTHLGKSACYEALDPRGKYRDILEEKDGLFRLKPPSN